MNDVELFAQDKNMMDKLNLLKKGALIAQDPASFESIDMLEPDEREALRFEAAHKWRHPLALYFTIIVCSIGAAVQGWNQTGSNGANLSFPREFGIGNGESESDTPNRIRDSWLVGLVNAGPYIGSAFIGCWLSDPCNFYFGRRGTIFVPETKQQTLEELDYIFAVPGRKFIAYQTGKAAPWCFNRWILWRRGVKLEPLYDMDRTIEGRSSDLF